MHQTSRDVRGRLRCKEEPPACPNAETNVSILHPLQCLKIYFNITPPSTPRSSKRALSFVFRQQFCMHFWSVPCLLYLGERSGCIPIRKYRCVKVVQVRIARVNKFMRFFSLFYTPFTSPNACADSRPRCGSFLCFYHSIPRCCL
jgi:hypothetical protein